MASFWSLHKEDVHVDGWEELDYVTEMEAATLESEAAIELSLHRDATVENEKLVAEAKSKIASMEKLLGKVTANTATKEEVARLKKVESELKKIKVSITSVRKDIADHELEHARKSKIAKEFKVMKHSKRASIRQTLKIVENAETVDLLFLLDCTGSMGSYIESAKRSVKLIAKKVQNTNRNLKLRIGMVAYRDIGDSNRFEVLNFTDSIESFERFVSHLGANGGGDGPEDIAGAIQNANQLSWAHESRVVFLIADYPCHGTNFHNGMGDDYPAGTPGINIIQELRILQQKGRAGGMHFNFGRITSLCDKMLEEFNKAGVPFQVCDVSNHDRIASSASSSIRKSISCSVTAASSTRSKRGAVEAGTEKDFKPYKIVPAKPTDSEWTEMKQIQVKVFRNEPVTSLRTLKKGLKFGMLRWSTAAGSVTEAAPDMILCKSPNPFAEGASRLAYYGRLFRPGSELLSATNNIICKTFKAAGSTANARDVYLHQMEISSIAHFLADKYNKEFRPDHCTEIHFLEAFFVEADDTTSGGSSNERYCVEAALPDGATDFTKYSNNTGYWNDVELNQSLLLFTKFTHDISKGYLVVTDLQGVYHNNKFVLTDPAILCTDETRFGGTNLGPKFIDRCINSTLTHLEENDWI